MVSAPRSRDDELPVRLVFESVEDVVWPTESELTELINRIGGRNDHFLILDPIPYLPRVFMQTYRTGDGPFELEYRDGGIDHFQVVVGAPETVLRTMLAWARDEPGWRTEHDWQLLYQHTVEEAPPLPAEAESYARETARRMVDVGLRCYDDIVQMIMDGAEPETSITRPQAESLLEPLWMAKVEQQKSWLGTTDADRFKAVFDTLNDTGITARMNFTCCTSCGVAEIRGEAADADHGFAFFHYQDAESAVAGSVYLTYGAYSGEPEDGVAVGHEIVDAFEAAGVSTEWNGSIKQRILVTGLDWRKRLE